MLKFDDLKKYFEQFLTNYGPYRNNKIYSIIIDNLLKYHINDSYNNVPADFKSAYEEQKIPISFYDNILLSVGFTQELITKISYKDKEILLKTFTNFNIYKGTINQIQKVASDFEEDLNLYELLIDFREISINFYYIRFYKNTNYIIVENEYVYNAIKLLDHIVLNNIEYIVKEKSNSSKIILDKVITYTLTDEYIEVKNFNIKRWVFLPELVYGGNKVKSKVLKDFLDYESIYNKTPRYFLSKEYLEELNKNQSLILPIKSNLVFLDYKKFRDVNLLNYLISAIILKYYRKSRILLYFKDGKYSTSLEKVYKLWYYIIYKFYNKSIINSGLPNPSLIFSIDSPYFKLDISDIPKILNEYSKIETQPDISLFYKKYFTNSFSPLNSFESEVQIQQLELLMEREIGTELIEYINSRIDFAKGINSEFECSFILDEIYASIFTWAFTNKIEDINYLTDSLSYISTDIDNSPTYNLILFLKPYHVDLIKESDDLLEINNKFNLVNPSHKKQFLINFYIGSLLNISHNLFKSELMLFENNSIIILNSARDILITYCKDFIRILDDIYQIINYETEIINFQNHKNLNFLKNLIYSFVIVLSEANILILQKNNNIINIENSTIDSLIFSKEIINNNNHSISNFINNINKNNLIISNEFDQNLKIEQLETDIINNYNVNKTINLSKEIITSNNHSSNIDINILKNDNLITITESSQYINNINFSNNVILNNLNNLINFSKETINFINHKSNDHISIILEHSLSDLMKKLFFLIKYQFEYFNINHEYELKELLKIMINKLLFIINYKYYFNLNIVDMDSSGKPIFDDNNIDILLSNFLINSYDSDKINLNLNNITILKQDILNNYNQFIFNKNKLEIELFDDNINTIYMPDLDTSGKAIYDSEFLNLFNKIKTTKLISDQFLFSYDRYSSMIVTDSFYISIDP